MRRKTPHYTIRYDSLSYTLPEGIYYGLSGGTSKRIKQARPVSGKETSRPAEGAATPSRNEKA